jgi:hypothetical protein
MVFVCYSKITILRWLTRKRPLLAFDSMLFFKSVYVALCNGMYLFVPFGRKMYRYGFQGQETELELWNGESSFFKYRISDNRIGRFFAIDPLMAKYPHNSPYAFSENRVIDGIELEGLEVHILSGSIHGVAGIAAPTWFGGAFAGSISLAYDQENNDIGVYLTGGPGVGVGFVASASVEYGFMINGTLDDVNSPSKNINFDGGEVLMVGGGVSFSAKENDANGDEQFDATTGHVGLGVGGGFVGASTTYSGTIELARGWNETLALLSGSPAIMTAQKLIKQAEGQTETNGGDTPTTQTNNTNTTTTPKVAAQTNNTGNTNTAKKLGTTAASSAAAKKALEKKRALMQRK